MHVAAPTITVTMFVSLHVETASIIKPVSHMTVHG